MTDESVQNKKLISQGVTTIPAYTGSVGKFFGGNDGVSVRMSPRFNEVIFGKASAEVSCEEHRKEKRKLSVHMHNSAILTELEQKSHQTIDQYLASIMSRINLWKDSGEYGLLNSGYANIEYVNVGNRVVAVRCVRNCDWWEWHCVELEVVETWNQGDQVSLPV